MHYCWLHITLRGPLVNQGWRRLHGMDGYDLNMDAHPFPTNVTEGFNQHFCGLDWNMSPPTPMLMCQDMVLYLESKHHCIVLAPKDDDIALMAYNPPPCHPLLWNPLFTTLFNLCSTLVVSHATICHYSNGLLWHYSSTQDYTGPLAISVMARSQLITCD